MNGDADVSEVLDKVSNAIYVSLMMYARINLFKKGKYLTLLSSLNSEIDMKKILTASDIFKENEYDIIFLPESLLQEIDLVIKQNNYSDREEFISSAVEKFIHVAIEEKIQRCKIRNGG